MKPTKEQLDACEKEFEHVKKVRKECQDLFLYAAKYKLEPYNTWDNLLFISCSLQSNIIKAMAYDTDIPELQVMARAFDLIEKILGTLIVKDQDDDL